MFRVSLEYHRRRLGVSWAGLVVFHSVTFLLAACRLEEPVSPTRPAELSVPSTPEPTEPQTFPASVTGYDLGQTTITQDNFPEDSPFHHMPVRLQGIIGVPESEQPHPLVLIMHGSHAACPGENVWPCPPEEEQKNYEGFAYLVRALAEAGYVGLSINVNAEHTFGFGEAPPAVRTTQLIELHLNELAAANAGQSDEFDIDLVGRVDLTRMTWLGHSRGGEIANRILRDQNPTSGDHNRAVQGLIMVAPAVTFADSLPTADVATAILLPACDQDLPNLDGQQYYEAARLDPDRRHFAMSVYLEGANHNYFNANLEPERPGMPAGRPDCTTDRMLEAEAQRAFLADYTVDFLQVLYGKPDEVRDAKRHLGILVSEPAPEDLYDASVKLTFLPAQGDQLALMRPDSQAELSRNLAGGEVRSVGLTVYFCPGGYYTPDDRPGTGPCKRVNLNQPGYPQQVAMEWGAGGADWRTFLPGSIADLTQFAGLQLRAALDPLSKLNPEGEPQSFTVELVDANGQHAHVHVPDVAYPAGVRQPNDFFEGDSFTGHVHMSTLRIPLEQFSGVDLANIVEIVLRFDQTESGALFVADLLLVQDD
jgi:hypothetical protein